MMNNPQLSSYYANQRPEMLQFVPEGVTRVLEIGCGNGVFARSVKMKFKAEVWGMDIRPDCIESAQKEMDEVVLGDIENDKLNLPYNFFDCVICNDVLEHLRDPWNVLLKISHYLKKDGYVVASIPNVRYHQVLKDLIVGKNWEYTEQGVLDRTHLRFFTQKTIRTLFENAGYKIIAIEGINSDLFSCRYRIFNWLALKHFDDTQYPQFACVAQKVSS